MGISGPFLDMFCGFVEVGHFAKTGAILDIGASELFCADDPKSLNRFCKFFGAEPYSATELVRMSNRAFAADLFRKVGYEYSAIDYADYPGIVRLDLNERSLPSDMRGQFDIVLNCGTSEHIMNQFNVFKTIHDACAAGGSMYHGVPAWGDYEHGVVNYNPKWFWALATANNYEIAKFWGSAELELRPLKDEFMQQIEFNHRPQGNVCWLSIILKRKLLNEFVALNDPAFSSEISASLQQAPASLQQAPASPQQAPASLRIIRKIYRKILDSL